jgi:SAM-dependent methyltransferase
MDIVQREPVPQPWAEHEKIPWDDPDFSQRMLAEHLSQQHDAASRRVALVERQVEWLHRDVLHERPARILDLGCGPGLYTSRLARLGHRCTGIDFGPASIAHARSEAERDGLDCKYVQDDIRRTAFGNDYDLIMFIFGELNVFHPGDADDILRRCRVALSAGGVLLLELHTYASVRAMGLQPPRWRAAQAGLFSSRPHLRLEEAHWDERQQAAIERYYVIDAATAAVSRYGATIQAYTEEGYERLLAAAGFGGWEWLGAWPGLDADEDFRLLLARAG